jgi:anti-sigma regulatory factor (Ser/Thr protein kinase)
VVPPNLAVVGRAVNDVVHLLAELLENATLFSPPESQVTLSAQLVPNGFAIEVEDRGLGMAPEAIDEANERLANPPDFDPQHSSRLGLFVVAKLAERQGIQVALRRSPYGGITAVTLIPSELVVAPGSLRPDTIEGDVVPNPISSRPPVASRIMALSGAPLRAEATDWPQRPEPRDEAATRTADGLPMRIRQASVARALPEGADETMEVAVTAPSRSPEEMRTMLASFQSGMTKGRKAAAGEAAGEALTGSTQNHSDKLSVANGHAPGREPHDVMAESGVVAPKTVTDEAIDAPTPVPAEPPDFPDFAVTPVASGERTAESGDLPPLPQRVGRHSHTEAAPVTGTGDMATRSIETLSTAEDGQPSAPRGGGNDDN